MLAFGRCYPQRHLICIASYLESGKPALLEEVLCHELAHRGARERHGDRLVLSFTGQPSDEPRISTDQRFGNIAFIFDARPREESNVARVFLRGGAEPTAIETDVRDPEMAERFAEAGQWNRFEGTLLGDLLSLTNGHEILEDRQLAGAPETGALTIEAAGPIDFANICVRELR